MLIAIDLIAECQPRLLLQKLPHIRRKFGANLLGVRGKLAVQQCVVFGGAIAMLVKLMTSIVVDPSMRDSLAAQLRATVSSLQNAAACSPIRRRRSRAGRSICRPRGALPPNVVARCRNWQARSRWVEIGISLRNRRTDDKNTMIAHEEHPGIADHIDTNRRSRRPVEDEAVIDVVVVADASIQRQGVLVGHFQPPAP